MTPSELTPFIYGFVVGTILAGSIPFLIRGSRHLMARVIAMAFAVGVSMLSALFVSQETFVLAHLIYTILTWSIPLLGLLLIFFGTRRLRGKSRIFFVALGALAILPAPVGFYATNIEPQRLSVNEFTVGTQSPGNSTIKIGVAADIQSPDVGDYERSAVRQLSEASTDVVLYAGDLYSGEDQPFPENREDFIGLVRTLSDGRPAFFVAGDHDSDGALPEIVTEGTGIFLNNEVGVVDIRGSRIGVLGLENNERSKDSARALASFVERQDIDYKIVLAHHLDAIFVTPAGVDLVVSGHTHGGQVQLPFIGPLLTLSSVTREQAAGGLFDLENETKLFVTRGVGVEHWTAPKVRFGSPPEVNVLNVAIPA